jgi:integration host factor subunit beta
MNRSELASALVSRFPQLQQKDAEQSVMVILEAITNSLIEGRRAEFRGFGSFSLNYKPPSARDLMNLSFPMA